MGCIFSLGVREVESRAQWQPLDVFIFFPSLRLPTTANFNHALQGYLSRGLLDRLSTLRTNISVFGQADRKEHGKKSPVLDSLNLSDLQAAIDEYLPVLLGLTKEGGQMISTVDYGWTNHESEQKETVLRSSRYELLSVLHLLAMVTLAQANACLTPKPPAEGYPPKVTEGDRKSAIETLLKAAQVLECAINISQRMPEDIRLKLPTDLREGVLRALQHQALGQGVEIQLGLAIDNVKASMAVKRRLACEQLKYWEQAQESLFKEPMTSQWGEKHVLFVRWKLTEAKAGAYYYHGLILDEGQEENTHAKAVACLQAAQNFLKESQKACMDFNSSAPLTRIPMPWASMKYFTEKIPKDALIKTRVNGDVYRHEKVPETLPAVPDFPLALKAEPFAMPPVDAAWSLEQAHETQGHPVTLADTVGMKHEGVRSTDPDAKDVEAPERQRLLQKAVVEAPILQV